MSLQKDCSPNLFAAFWDRAACSKWVFGVLLWSSLLESESSWQTCALLLEWWVEHLKSYRNKREQGRWLICPPQGDVSSVPNPSCLHLSWEQLIAAVSSSKRKRKSCSTAIPARCCDSCHLLAGCHRALASPSGTGPVAHKESPKSWGLFWDFKDHSGYLFCYVGKMSVRFFFYLEIVPEQLMLSLSPCPACRS